MEKHKTHFLEWNNRVLQNSFKKIDLSIILVIISDLLFYSSAIFLFTFWFDRVTVKMSSFNFPNNVGSLGLEIARQLLREEIKFYYLLVFSFIVLLMAIIFIASILKCIIWAKTTRTKITLGLISKFLMLNLVWMGFWFALTFLVAYIVQQEAVPSFLTAITIIGLYLTNTLYSVFMKQQSLKSIPYSIKLSISKLHLFFLPYTVIFLLLFIILQLSRIIAFNYSSIFFGLIAIIYLSIVRYYTSTLVNEIGKI